MTGYVADLSWKSGARAIEKLDRLRSTMAVNVLMVINLRIDRYYDVSGEIALMLNRLTHKINQQNQCK